MNISARMLVKWEIIIRHNVEFVLVGTKWYLSSFNTMTMRYSKLHKTLRIVLLFSVIFFSTGFTAIVKYCSMNQSSECCCDSDHSNNSTAQTNELSVSGEKCCTVKVIGGLNEIKAMVASEESAKLLAVETVPLNIEVLPLLPSTRSLSFTYTDDIAPPHEDICIRISSLLI